MTSHRGLLTAQITVKGVSQNESGPPPVQPLYFLQPEIPAALPKSGSCTNGRVNSDAERIAARIAPRPKTGSLGPIWLVVNQ
jgi:hypothetical protein